MVNIRAIGQKFTKSEAKELLDDAKKLIDDKVLGENFKRESLIKKKEIKKKVKVDGEERETINGELVTTVKTKTKVPKPDEKADEIIFAVKAGGKITPKMLADFNINKMNSKDDIVKFIDEVLREKSLKSSQIKASAKIFFTGINVDGIESIDENISNDKLNALIAKVVSAFRPTGKKKAKTLKGFVKQIKTYQIDLKIALDLRDYATIIRDFIFANKVLRRFYKELGLPETFTTQTGAEFNLIKPPTISAEDERVVSVEDEEELRGKGYII